VTIIDDSTANGGVKRASIEVEQKFPLDMDAEGLRQRVEEAGGELKGQVGGWMDG